MEETLSQIQDRWSDGLLKNGAGVASERVRSSLEIGNEELLIRTRGNPVPLDVLSPFVAWLFAFREERLYYSTRPGPRV